MKKLLFGLMLITQLSAFAGTLAVRNDAKKIDLHLDKETQEIVVVSEIADIKSQRIPLKNIQRLKSEINLKEYTDNISDAKSDAGSFYGTIGEVIVSIAYPFGVGLDLIMLPNKAMIKAIENSKYKKDIKKLNKTAADDERKVVVNENRFNRIIEALKKAAGETTDLAITDTERNETNEKINELEEIEKIGFIETVIE